MLTVINDILDFSKVEAGKVELELRDFNLRDCLETALKTLANRADEKGLELLCDIARDVPEVAGADSTRLRQIGGTGLGLTISARFIALMGGTIWMQSEPGEGVQFHFILPLKRSRSKIDMANPAPAELLHGVKVLVVDANVTNQRILLATLQHWHMQPFAVDGGVEALRALQAARDSGAPFQLILTDMHMPNMDGFDLVAHIRKQSDLSAATIMMLTSAGHSGDP